MEATYRKYQKTNVLESQGPKANLSNLLSNSERLFKSPTLFWACPFGLATSTCSHYTHSTLSLCPNCTQFLQFLRHKGLVWSSDVSIPLSHSCL